MSVTWGQGTPGSASPETQVVAAAGHVNYYGPQSVAAIASR